MQPRRICKHFKHDRVSGPKLQFLLTRGASSMMRSLVPELMAIFTGDVWRNFLRFVITELKLGFCCFCSSFSSSAVHCLCHVFSDSPWKKRNLKFAANLSRNESAFSNSFSSASASDLSHRDVGKGKTFTVSYLVDSLGFTTKLAESISSKVTFEDKGNPDSVLNLLKGYGFTDSQISSIITDYPQLLILNSEKSIGPKLQFLQFRGAPSSELTEIVSKVPKIWGNRLGKTISLHYDFVKEVIEADKSSKFENLSHSLPQGSKQENKIRNILALRELGVPQELFFPLLISDDSPVHGKEKFKESLKKVVEMGFDPTTSKFVHALRVVQGLSDKAIEEKVNVYKKLGLDVEDIWEMFKRWPVSLRHSEKKIIQTIETLKKFGLLEDEILSVFKKWPSFLSYSEKKINHTFETLQKCGLLEDEILSMFKKFPRCIVASEQRINSSLETFLSLGFTRDEYAMMVKRSPQYIGYSAESVKKKTEFLVKKMNWPLKALISNPAVYHYSMEKRIVPRCNVIKALMSKRLIGSELPSLSAVLSITDEAFLNKYVRKYDKKQLVLELMAIFTGDRVLLNKQH